MTSDNTLMESGQRDARMLRLQRLARILDSSIALPGGYRIGLDGFIGLVPGAGDIIGALLSSYIIVQSARLGASTLVLARMMLNVLIEAAVGLVPVVGDIFDFAWKANDRNVRLVEKHVSREDNALPPPRKNLGAAVFLLFGAFLLALLALIALSIWLLVALLAAVA